MVKQILYPVKVHGPGCTCGHYSDKTTNPNQILVSPYIQAYFKNRYFIYDTYQDYLLDKDMFVNNCLCTHTPGVYNGGVIIITDNININMPISSNDELENLQIVKLDEIKYNTDNSRLINNFCKMFPTLLSWHTLIGNTISDDSNINYTFPKGKVSICDNSAEDCCYREFAEETNYELLPDITNEYQQKLKRREKKLKHIPLDVIIDNFLMKIIVI